jgi:RNA 2',3'-cyclic 3'-phosphodiesterase
MARLFFAIWPGAAAAHKLAAVGESLAALAGGKPTPVEKIHLTLAFLGSLDAGETGSAALAASQVQAGPIRMTIDTVGSFRRARVGWAAPSRPVPELAALQSALAGVLVGTGFSLEDRAFTPHVTLVRKVEKPIPRAPMPAIPWRSSAFTLVQSTGDGRYEIVKEWELDPGSSLRSQRPG